MSWTISIRTDTSGWLEVDPLRQTEADGVADGLVDHLAGDGERRAGPPGPDLEGLERREGVGVAGDVDGGGDDGVEVGRGHEHRRDVGHAEHPSDPLEGVGLGLGDLDPAADEAHPAGRVAQRPPEVVAQGPFEPGAVAALEADLVVVGQEEVGVHAAPRNPISRRTWSVESDPHPPAPPVVEQFGAPGGVEGGDGVLDHHDVEAGVESQHPLHGVAVADLQRHPVDHDRLGGQRPEQRGGGRVGEGVEPVLPQHDLG